jgi:hypothetical protein
MISIMRETTSRAIADLYALAKVVDSEYAERIHEIIERLQSLDEHGDEQANIYMKLSRP